MNEEQLAQLPESVREWDEAKNSDTPEVFWDRMGNMRSKIGTGLYQPSEEAGSEDWSKFTNRAVELSDNRLIPRPDLEDEESRTSLFRTLGMPEEEGGYEFSEVEGAEINEDYRNFIKKIAHKVGLTKNQLKYMDEEISKANVSQGTIQQDEFNTNLGKLKQDWGLAYEDRVHQAEKVVEAFFPALKDANLSATDLTSFYALAKQLGAGEGSQEFARQGSQGQAAMSPDDAAMAISEIRSNKAHPYNNVQDPGHAAAKKKMRNLYLVKNGKEPE